MLLCFRLLLPLTLDFGALFSWNFAVDPLVSFFALYHVFLYVGFVPETLPLCGYHDVFF